MDSETTLVISAIIFAVILFSWLALIIITRLNYRRAIGLPLFYRGSRNMVPYPSLRVAQEAADNRRTRLLAFLSGFQTALPVEEFIDLPSGFESPDRQQSPEEEVLYWRATRLQLQLETDHHLLIERVMDFLIYLYRIGQIPPPEFPTCVRLEPIQHAEKRGQFPWRVVIATNHPQILFHAFSDPRIQEWLGIGIDLTPSIDIEPSRGYPGTEKGEPFSRRVRPFGRCREGTDGLQGTVGGLVQNWGAAKYGVTCRHVLSSTCTSIYWPRPVRPATREFIQESPDAAFIGLDSECFILLDQEKKAVPCANLSDIELAMQRGTKLVKSPDRDGTFGVVRVTMASGFLLGKYFYRGFHISITPYFYKWLWITWPLRRRFSVAGDSGAWILDTETRKWIGMVVGGYKRPNVGTYAIASQYILDSFQRRDASPIPPITEILLWR